MDIADTTTQGEMTPQADLTSKVKSRRKLGIQKSLSQECKPTEGAGDSGSEKLSYSMSNIIDVKVLLFVGPRIKAPTPPTITPGFYGRVG